MRRLAHFALFAGIVVAVVSTGLVHVAIRAPVQQGHQNPVWAYVVYAALLVLAAVVMGLPDEPRDWQPAIASSFAAVIAGTGVFSLVQLVRPGLLPRFVLTSTALVLWPWFTLCCVVSRSTRRHQRRRDRVLAVLDAEDGAIFMADSIAGHPRHEQVFTLVDITSPEMVRSDRHGAEPLLDACRGNEATVLVLSEEAQRDDRIVIQAGALHRDGVRIRSLEGFYDEWFGKLPLSSLSRMALMTDIGEVHRGSYPHTKRVLDIAAAFVGLVLALPVVLLVWVGNHIANRGPLFFRQERVGRNNTTFTMIKFRTMRPEGASDASSSALEWTTPDDPRITPFGRLLRRAHLDEFPQMWNVLRGDLSLVGPRPEQPHYVHELQQKLPFYDLRHVVQPGVTGWAQVKYRYGSSEADAFEKLQYDLFYLRHQSMTLDLRIISRTVRSVLFGRGR
jgi:exopolysaccharide biosynthesis polyprenyl glycosylphosphotransferase